MGVGKVLVQLCPRILRNLLDIGAVAPRAHGSCIVGVEGLCSGGDLDVRCIAGYDDCATALAVGEFGPFGSCGGGGMLQRIGGGFAAGWGYVAIWVLGMCMARRRTRHDVALGSLWTTQRVLVPDTDVCVRLGWMAR